MASGMAYDAANGQVVLFGGGACYQACLLDETWTWDGDDWSERRPEHSPPPRFGPGMAYDAARGHVVLFGGFDGSSILDDTWTWDGTDWAQRSPAHIPPPRWQPGIADDSGLGQVVMFGGGDFSNYLNDTWTWDGTDWAERTPAHVPPAAFGPAMSYDAARGQVVNFGGFNGFSFLSETWTWDGADWTHRYPVHSPMPRFGPGMAYDAARGETVLFGGYDGDSPLSLLGDTWAWDGTDWEVARASLDLTPASGPPGSVVDVEGSGFGAGEAVVIRFIDAIRGKKTLAEVTADASGAFVTQVKIPGKATSGKQAVSARGRASGQYRKHGFLVT